MSGLLPVRCVGVESEGRRLAHRTKTGAAFR
jgi:hypothetical protein